MVSIDVIKFLHEFLRIVVETMMWCWSRCFTIYPDYSPNDLDGHIDWPKLPKGSAWEHRIKKLKSQGLAVGSKRGFGASVYVLVAGLGEMLHTPCKSWQKLEKAVDKIIKNN